MKRTFPILVAVVLLAASAFAFEGPAAKSFEAPRGTFDRAGHFRAMAELQNRLSGSVDLSNAQALEVAVSADELAAVRQGNGRERKLRVGVVKEIAVPMNFMPERMSKRAAQHEMFGAMQRGTNGFEWAGVVRTPGAAAIRVHFTDFDLPEGAALYAYAGGMAFGPYTGRGPNGDGDFWSNSIAGSELTLQLQAGVDGTPHFTIAGVGHLTSEFQMAGNLKPRADARACSFNASCVQDAACGTNAAVNAAKDAVAHILFASGAYLYICSGGLIADSDTGTNIPYFLTANHCISRSSEAASMETFFFYESGSCGSCPDPGAANTSGATIVATNRTSDYTIMRLSQNAPAGAAFLGWNSTAVANSNNTPLYRISHPKGAPQSYSEQVVDTSKVTCQSWPRGNWIYSRDTYGATEGGSSGSPVVNGAGQVVGQLSGACGYNVNDVCDEVANGTVDGAFAAYYSAVSSFLGPGGGGGCTDADGDGVCASQGDCNDNNNKIFPGNNDTKGKQGRDGVDNDCDGIIDG